MPSFNKLLSRVLILLLALLLNACGMKNNAPVENAWYQTLNSSGGTHTVRAGETIYAISVLYGVDVNQLIKYNRLTPPYRIYPGERLYISRSEPQAAPKASAPVKKASPTVVKKTTKTRSVKTQKATTGKVTWQWPAKGRIVRRFSTAKGSKGIDIAGKYGNNVVAAASGKVVYSGSGLANYGKLIIIKNSNVYLSAYAHNSKLLVKEGQWVKAGQKIAEMGNDSNNQTALHFEIRYKGKPVNPLNYLPKA